jgi:hypothetical protein
MMQVCPAEPVALSPDPYAPLAMPACVTTLTAERLPAEVMLPRLSTETTVCPSAGKAIRKATNPRTVLGLPRSPKRDSAEPSAG